ncbi:uncharacterized protein LOC135827931 [Sycon ciliatum]|uniref:uncharacterized protein LOC135827931 n=1 Tax=Sycon ciliatum TaxID=27933 RepID=UPI0031F68785
MATSGGNVSSNYQEIERQLAEAVNLHQFRRIQQDGRPAIERTFRILFGGREEVVRAIIQPDANPNTPPRFWCPGASSADSAANAELYELTYRKSWTAESTISGLAASITDALCSKDLFTRETNPRFNMTRGASFDSTSGAGGGNSLYGGSSSRWRNPPTVHGSTHTAPHPVSLQRTHDAPVLNRSSTAIHDQRGTPVIYSDTSRRQHAHSTTDLDLGLWSRTGAGGNAGRFEHDIGRPSYPREPAAAVSSSKFSPGTYGHHQLPPGSTSSPMDPDVGGSGHHPVVPSGSAPVYRQRSGVIDAQQSTSMPPHSQQQRPDSRNSSGNHSSSHSGPHNSSGHMRNVSGPMNSSGYQSTAIGSDYGHGGGSGGGDQSRGGQLSDYDVQSFTSAAQLKKVYDDLQLRHQDVRGQLNERDDRLATANHRIKQLDLEVSDLSSKLTSSWVDVDQKNNEIRSLHSQVQQLMHESDRSKVDIESLKQELRLSQAREAQARMENQSLSSRCNTLEGDLRHVRASQPDGKVAAGEETNDLKINSLILQLEQAKLQTSEHQRHTKEAAMEKERMRQDLDVQKGLVESLVAQVKDLEQEFGKVPNGNGSSGAAPDRSPSLRQSSLRATPGDSMMHLPLDPVSCEALSDRQRAEYYRSMALDAQKDRQEVYVLFTSKIADYDIVKMVAHGCEGAVYLVRCKKARLPNPAKLFAVKVMFNIFQMETMTQIRREFQNEYELLAMLPPHPNVIRLCAFFFDRIGKNLPDLPPEVRERARSMSLFIVLEYVPLNLEAVCLEKRVSNRITVMDMIDWAYQVADALHFLAINNVVHRDMKLNNILVTDRGQIKVCDFGCAVRLDDASMKMKMFPNMPKGGNPAHLAPEVLNAEYDGTDAYCDYSKQPVFELGVMIFEMLHDVSPFKKLDQRGYSMAGIPRLDISRLYYPPEYALESLQALAADLQTLQQRFIEFDMYRRPSVAEMHSALWGLHDRARSLVKVSSSQSSTPRKSPFPSDLKSKEPPSLYRQASADQEPASPWSLNSS